MLKRQRQSAKLTTEQIQRKLAENALFKDDLSKNAPVNTVKPLLVNTFEKSFFCWKCISHR